MGIQAKVGNRMSSDLDILGVTLSNGARGLLRLDWSFPRRELYQEGIPLLVSCELRKPAHTKEVMFFESFSRVGGKTVGTLSLTASA